MKNNKKITVKKQEARTQLIAFIGIFVGVALSLLTSIINDSMKAYQDGFVYILYVSSVAVVSLLLVFFLMYLIKVFYLKPKRKH